jgi:D-aminopeptidase
VLALPFDERRIDAVLAGLDHCHAPGAAVGIAVGGRPVYRRGFGLASMELPVVLSPAIRMRIGSITKHFTALAYLLLCEEGRASLDDPISRYLPELHTVAQRVTARQLLAHTSGLRDAMDLVWQFSGADKRLTSADILALYREMEDVNFAPGTAWMYNNGGYLLVSVAIERIAGKPLEDVLRERIFVPIGMQDTLLRRTDTGFVSNSATLHASGPGGGFEKSGLGAELAGEGGMVSTADDMLRWLAHMDAPRVGSAATWQVLRTPQILSNGTSTGYGLGLISSRYRGVETISHEGGVIGGSAEMIKVPAARLDVVVLVNRQDVSATQLANGILDACLPDLHSGGWRDAVVGGVFRSPATGRVVRFSARDGQQIASIDGVDMLVESDEDGMFWQPASWRNGNVTLRIAGDRASPRVIQLSDFGNLDELLPARPAGAHRIAGRYRSQTSGVEMVIEESGAGVSLTAIGRFGSVQYRCEPLAEHIWQARYNGPTPWGGKLSFDSDTMSFRYFSFRTRGLVFRRVA